jgi:methylmalonyl-CoA mutase
MIQVVKAAGYDLVIAETAGIGQGDSHIIDMVDMSMYVMTSEFGAASQLEKIDMLDFADLVVVNKYRKTRR